MTLAFIGVDWGTTNLRAWAVDGNGELRAEAESAQGIGALSGDGFVDVLRALVGRWTDGRVPIVMGGMIGSRQGWREAPYLACPARVETLAAAALSFDTGLGPGWIVPGLSCQAQTGVTDVMRGEEVQLCGLERGDGLVVLPGTHSKWVEVRGGQIVRFRTFMTGELFALLKAHSILGRLMMPGDEDLDAFDTGVARAVADPRADGAALQRPLRGAVRQAAAARARPIISPGCSLAPRSARMPSSATRRRRSSAMVRWRAATRARSNAPASANSASSTVPPPPSAA